MAVLTNAKVLKVTERLEQLRDALNQLQQCRSDSMGVDMSLPITPTAAGAGFGGGSSSGFDQPTTTTVTQASAVAGNNPMSSQYWPKGSGYGAGTTHDSVLDISKHVKVFESVVGFISAISQTPKIKINIARFGHLCSEEQFNAQQLIDIDILSFLLMSREDLVNLLRSEGVATQTAKSVDPLHEKLKNLAKNIEIYLNKVKKSKPSQYTGNKKRQRKIQFEVPGEGPSYPGDDKNDDASTKHGSSIVEEEESLDKVYDLILTACAAIEKKLEVSRAEEQAEQHRSMPGTSGEMALTELINWREKAYCDAMRNIQFESIPFYDPSGTSLAVPYHYAASLSSGQTGSAKRTRRLAQEIVTLNTSLPLTLGSSVFVRASEERLDTMKVLITGPSDTPYANGCFEFDIFFPADYPNSPMLVNLETTGNRTVRFNPNLYDDGKVCLSILNTWRGRPEERWNAESSSLLQVIVSIQSLILVNDPYFNEPGYERWRNTPAGQQASRDYDANIRQMCVRWAMTEVLKHPPKAFADVIKRHFWLKRDEICEQVEGWIDEMQGYVGSKGGSGKTLPAYLSGLKKQFDSLKAELAKLLPPEGLEMQPPSTRFPTQLILAEAKPSADSTDLLLKEGTDTTASGSDDKESANTLA